ALRARLVYLAAQYVPDQSFRPVRPAPGLALLSRTRVHAPAISHAVLLSLRAPSALRRLAPDVLVCARNDDRSLVLRNDDNCIYPGCDPLRRGRSGRGVRGEVPPIQGTSADADPYVAARRGRRTRKGASMMKHYRSRREFMGLTGAGLAGMVAMQVTPAIESSDLDLVVINAKVYT